MPGVSLLKSLLLYKVGVYIKGHLVMMKTTMHIRSDKLRRCLVFSLLVFRSLKRSNPHLIEDVVLIRALRDSNLPKFLVDDALLFG